MAESYDPKKAALYNKLRQQGLSEDAAGAQAGIPEGGGGIYVVTGAYNADGTKNPNPGSMGSDVQGSSKVAGVDYDRPTAAEDAQSAREARAEAADSARFDRGLQSESNFEQVDFQVEAKNPPGKVTPINYTTTSTETVSGGGSTNTVSGPRAPNAASEAIQPALDAKQAEINQFRKDNPDDYTRKKRGLDPLSEEEKDQRDRQLLELNKEKSELRNKQIDAESTTPATVTTVPNTTTTTETVTSGTTSTNEAVDSSNDQQQQQQTDVQVDAQGRAPNASTATAAAPVAATTDPAAAPPPAAATGQEVPVSSPAPAPAATVPAAQSLGPGEEIVPVSTPATVAPGQNPAAAQVDAANNPGAAVAADNEAVAAQARAAQQAATLDKARAQNTIANQRSNKNNADWRVKLRLAPLADYLYMAKPPGILAPLAPDGVIFPYTPTIQTSYKANYATTDITHSNYRGYFYQGSAVEPFTVSSTFTAQSTAEAEYLLAVIHFFRSVTKMFYGQDPQRGTPPPLVYLTGLGEFQFNEHPCVVSGFTYDLPADVDYIRAYSPNVNNSNMLQQRQSNNSTGPGTSWGNGILGGVLGGAVNRLATSKLLNGQPLPKGGQNIPPAPPTLASNTIPTYVPTKMTIAVSLLPVVSRQAQSQRFSVRQYATGDLQKGGMW